MSLINELKQCNNIHQLANLTQKLTPVIGTFGGRRFVTASGPESIDLNDLVIRANLLYPGSDKTPEVLITTLCLIRKIKHLDQAANALLSTKCAIIRIMTDLKRYFGGNVGLREWILLEIHSNATQLQNIYLQKVEEQQQEALNEFIEAARIATEKELRFELSQPSWGSSAAGITWTNATYHPDKALKMLNPRIMEIVKNLDDESKSTVDARLQSILTNTDLTTKASIQLKQYIQELTTAKDGLQMEIYLYQKLIDAKQPELIPSIVFEMAIAIEKLDQL